MGFGSHLAQARKEHHFSQAQLAERVGIHVTQLRRYEAETSQPTLEVLMRLAQALNTSIDALAFGPEGRGPDDELRLQFEALQDFSAEEKAVAKSVIESLILKHDAQRWTAKERAGSGA